MTAQKNKETLNVNPSIEFIEGRSNKYNFYWHIYANKVRAGHVFINFSEDPVLGRHASIQIFLNKKSQGKGIGRIGYQTACEKSGLEIIYAHMRKNNIASRKAAIAAGFREVEDNQFNQLVMMWHK